MALSSLHLSLEANQRATARRIFNDIIHAFEHVQTRLCDRYDAVTLIRVMRDGVVETDAFCFLHLYRGGYWVLIGEILGRCCGILMMFLR